MIKRKGITAGFVVSLMTLILVLGMGGVLQAAPKSIKVSAVISMTGPMAGNGIQLHEAYQIIVDKINGRPRAV